jgi:hypothetical protein
MGKIKITQEQYKRLFSKNITESADIAGGLNRVDKSFAAATGGSAIKNLKEEPFNIKSASSGLPAQKAKKENSINEEAKPSGYQAIHDFIENIWMNPSQKNIDPFFEAAKLSWEDVTNYLIAAGVLADVGEGQYKVKNYFKTKFSKNPQEVIAQKMQDIDKLSKMLEKNPKAPWAAKEEKPKADIDESTGNSGSPYPAGTEHDPASPWNQDDSDIERSNAPQVFKPVVLGRELAILKGPKGLYLFNLDDISRKDLPNPEYHLSADDIADYINDNLKTIQQGQGIAGFEQAPLVLIDDELKAEILALYSGDKKVIQALNQVQEMTSAAGGGAGAFVGPLNAEPPIKRELTEITSDAPSGNVTSSSNGAYVQPAIWAKDKKNWAGDKKTQYPHGEIVDFDPCTKLNNNKKAENGGCSQGAVDGVVKTHKTKQSVISKTVYETIAKKTGRKVEDIQKLIESKLNNTKSLS